MGRKEIKKECIFIEMHSFYNRIRYAFGQPSVGRRWRIPIPLYLYCCLFGNELLSFHRAVLVFNLLNNYALGSLFNALAGEVEVLNV